MSVDMAAINCTYVHCMSMSMCAIACMYIHTYIYLTACCKILSHKFFNETVCKN